MSIVGIDPGLTGALAYIGDNGKAEVMDMPLTKGMHDTHIVDTEFIIDVVLNVWNSPDYVIIERPIWRKGNGAKQTTTTWFNYGRLTAAFEEWGEIVPSVWKKAMDVSQDKSESIALARSLFPDLAGMLSRQKDHNRSEALLIAEWFRRSLD